MPNVRNSVFYLERIIDRISRRFQVGGTRFHTKASRTYDNRDEFDPYIDRLIGDALKRRESLPQITGVYRLRNAACFIEQSILAAIPLCKKFIVFDNDSSDDTVDRVTRLKHQFDGHTEIDIFHYPHQLAPAGNRYLEEVKKSPSSSLSKYYNTAFSKVTTDYALKIDGHCIYNIHGIVSLQDRISTSDVIYYRGAEFYGKHLSVEPYLFKSTLGITYRDSDRYEVCKIPDNVIKSFVKAPCFIHMKRLFYVTGAIDGQSGLHSLYKNQHVSRK